MAAALYVMKSEEELQLIWNKVVEIGFDSYKKLNREQRVWFNLEPLTTEGLWDHYVNGGGKYNKDIREDLLRLGFPQIAQLLARLNKLFPPLVLGSIWRVNMYISSWPEGKNEALIEEVDNAFWEIEPKLTEAIARYVDDNIDDIAVRSD